MIEDIKHFVWRVNHKVYVRSFKRRAEYALFYADEDSKNSLYATLYRLKEFKSLPLDKQRLILGTCILYGLNSVDAQINAHYWTQTLQRKNVGEQILVPWRHKEGFFRSNNGSFRFGAIKINSLDYLRSLSSGYEALLANIKSQDAFRLFVKAALSNRSILLISNHSGWQNLPFLSTIVHDILECSLARMTTVIGPAVANLHLANSVANLSNLIVTIPPSAHAALPENLSKQQKNISMRALKTMINLKNDNLPPILIMCPFGTTDKIDSEKIILQNIESAESVVSILVKRGFRVFTAATYDKDGSLSGAQRNTSGSVLVRFNLAANGTAAESLKVLFEDLERISGKKVITLK